MGDANDLGASLQALTRPAAGEPEGLLVLFHGRGADEHDLVPLRDALDPRRRLLGITPRGPLALPPAARTGVRVGKRGATVSRRSGATRGSLGWKGLFWRRWIR